MRTDDYIWISRWDEFQHYPPQRDRGPAWIKSYAAQLDDEAYWRLSNRQRALLHDLRLMFATMRSRLPHDRRMIESRRLAETRQADLDALNDAGFIRVVSREGLEECLEVLYASRAPARSPEEDVEEETDTEEPPSFLPNLTTPKGSHADPAGDDDIDFDTPNVTTGRKEG